MKPLGLSVVAGILLALLVISILHPLPVAAAGLVVVLCVGFTSGIAGVLKGRRAQEDNQ